MTCAHSVHCAGRKIPDNRRAISSKVVLKLKYKADGTPDKHKGRLVARGFESNPGADFFGTFAPMYLTTVRTLFAIAVHTIDSDGKSLPIIQADIPQAFLQPEIDVPQCIMLPKGITVNPGYTALDTADWDNRIVRLLRSLYGLKSAPQIWNKILNEILLDDLKLKRAASDSCLYHYRDDNGWIWPCTEVDDLVITGTNEKKNFPHPKLVYHRRGSAVADHLSHLSEKDTALTSLSSKKFRAGNSDPMDPAFGMSDSDYAGSATPGRKSISGRCFFVFCNLVTWKSKLQPLTAGPTHEAELISMSFVIGSRIRHSRCSSYSFSH